MTQHYYNFPVNVFDFHRHIKNYEICSMLNENIFFCTDVKDLCSENYGMEKRLKMMKYMKRYTVQNSYCGSVD